MTKTKWQTQYNKNNSASNFHNKLQKIFSTDTFFKNLACYQEVNVVDLIEDYPYRNHHYDWYIDELQTIVELHGAQHYKVTNRGGIGMDQAKREFLRQQDRDNSKKTAALDAGYTYLEVSYKREKHLTGEMLKNLIYTAGETHG